VSLLLATLLTIYTTFVVALGQKKTISFEKVRNGVTLFERGRVADILVDAGGAYFLNP